MHPLKNTTAMLCYAHTLSMAFPRTAVEVSTRRACEGRDPGSCYLAPPHGLATDAPAPHAPSAPSPRPVRRAALRSGARRHWLARRVPMCASVTHCEPRRRMCSTPCAQLLGVHRVACDCIRSARSSGSISDCDPVSSDFVPLVARWRGATRSTLDTTLSVLGGTCCSTLCVELALALC